MNKHSLILKTADITAMPGEKRIHFLNPNAVRINKSLGDAVGLTQIGVHIISVKPGHDTTEYHKHFYEEECVYILSGQGTAIIDGERDREIFSAFLATRQRTILSTMVMSCCNVW